MSRKSDWIALAFAMLFPTAMAALYFLVLPGRVEGDNAGLKLGFSLGKLLQFGFPALYVFFTARSALQLSKPSTRGLGLGIAFGLFVAVGMIGLYFGLLKGTTLLAKSGDKIQTWLRGFGLDNQAGFLGVAIFVSVAHSLLEEYYWRWFVFGWLDRHVPRGWAYVISGLGFMSHHVIVLGVYLPGYFWTLAVPMSLAVAFGGIVWAWIYARGGSLLAIWVSHAIVDAAIMVVGWDLVFGLPV